MGWTGKLRVTRRSAPLTTRRCGLRRLTTIPAGRCWTRSRQWAGLGRGEGGGVVGDWSRGPVLYGTRSPERGTPPRRSPARPGVTVGGAAFSPGVRNSLSSLYLGWLPQHRVSGVKTLPSWLGGACGPPGRPDPPRPGSRGGPLRGTKMGPLEGGLAGPSSAGGDVLLGTGRETLARRSSPVFPPASG